MSAFGEYRKTYERRAVEKPSANFQVKDPFTLITILLLFSTVFAGIRKFYRYPNMVLMHGRNERSSMSVT
jgi:hypothetical protein